ncbi:MAG: acyl-CoA dehydrogenase [Bdellovibrio sp. CG12_big_fil_rev_8_21_14_0_65_39_13]|nr:MAG: acyl-CoA dehydrogenase [Bdellovibrio sp. CG22_combo_CG10-13_8_21_14_all_39_27]PIQ60007.1 MAG: acyl-CoA dehydrogenase [Bdellovibrio sp. CG12_big_fil_rev_8_21_14_0_65_39_13]PIR35266.1 MAG: acyl-CoA dehydrogenase [Bdellovibrio sp. CG11_big_fil_rev_8_21_14_0_20_39_38]
MSEELKSFRDTFKRWIEKEIIPFHEEWEKAGMVPRELYKKAGEQGFLCPLVKEEYGGLGLDYHFSAVITEELSFAMVSGVAFWLHSDIIVPYIEHYGNETQKQKYLPGCVSGDYVTAVAMTEPGTGSDLQGISTKAVLEGDHWVLNGAKTFISNGHVANLYVVVAETPAKDPNQKFKSLSLFLVEENDVGFERGRKLQKIGLKAQDTAELAFVNCRIPKDRLLGEEGKGFIYLSNELAQERLGVAIMSQAMAEKCVEITADYVKGRKAFKKRIADFQNTRFKLAECATEVKVGRAFVDRLIEIHAKEKCSTVEASMAKTWCSEMFCRVADECLQLHGGYGYMWEYTIARAYADARVQRIYAGTNEIMKEIIARDLLDK